MLSLSPSSLFSFFTLALIFSVCFFLSSHVLFHSRIDDLEPSFHALRSTDTLPCASLCNDVRNILLLAFQKPCFLVNTKNKMKNIKKVAMRVEFVVFYAYSFICFAFSLSVTSTASATVSAFLRARSSRLVIYDEKRHKINDFFVK